MIRERAGVAAMTAAFLYVVFFRAGILIYPFPSGSNGVFFDEAHRILAGEVMYRDFFEFVGPGTAYLNALVLLACGPRIAALGTQSELAETSAVYREIYEHGMIEQEFIARLEATA